MFYPRSFLFCLLWVACTGVSAQEFYGFVKKADSASTPIFQAIVEITAGDKAPDTIRTYFDGSFKFAPEKSRSYQIRISYAGYLDTTYSFTTDKKGIPSAQNITVRLQKDGMRLIGVVRSRDENFPIEDATVILKNIMTRQEDRITTGIDGAYNFKLEYETNYRISIDKRSSGIINKYRDTVFYISTVGFNLPLDYKLDIYLETDLYPNTRPREGYDPERKPENKHLKPSFSTATPRATEAPQPFKEEKLKEAEETITKLQAELEQKQKELEKARKEKEKKEKATPSPDATRQKTRKPGKKEKEPEVVIIRDTPADKKPASESKQETKKSEPEIPQSVEKTNSPEPDPVAMPAADSVAAPKPTPAKTADTIPLKDTLSTPPAKDTVQKAPAPKVSDSKATPAARPDTATPVIAPAAPVRPPVTDSLRLTKPASVKPTSSIGTRTDTIPSPKTSIPYITKSQEELIRAAEQFAREKKMRQDSLARLKTQQDLLLKGQQQKQGE